jgi:hypothetical protein
MRFILCVFLFVFFIKAHGQFSSNVGLEYQWFERWMLEAQFTQGLKQLYVNPNDYNYAKMRTYSFGIGYILSKK